MNSRHIESGDLMADHVPVQAGGYLGVEDNELSFIELRKAGHIGMANFSGVAMVTPAVRKGATFAYFGFPGNPANSVVPRVPDPITNRHRFKLGKGRIKKLGESPYKTVPHLDEFRAAEHRVRAGPGRRVRAVPSCA